MDLYCTKCGEPMDNDEFHEIAAELEITYTEAVQTFAREGCNGFAGIGYRCSAPRTDTDNTFGLRPQDASMALFDLLGDDTDGIAAMMEDMGF
jgi:hypothetical protein